MSQLVMNNVVSKDKMREVQIKTLTELSEILKKSFGPYGSNSCIKKENALPRYSKDGHTIIGAVHYNGIIEQSIKDDIESITRHIVKTVGDGTTSAVILSKLVFEYIVHLEGKTGSTPYEIIAILKKVVNDIKSILLSSAKQLTVDDVYDITMISTNGNEFIANTLKQIYEEFGNSVYIDVSPSTGEEFIVKSYNGMTLNSGYCDSCYVTNQSNNTSEVDNPAVYFFEDPVDTKEMGVYLDSILSNNIITPVNTQNYNSMVPTVIFAPKISRDMSSIMDSLTSTMAQMPVNNRLPICIITDYHEVDQLNDLAKMCGARMIKKYIDLNVYKADVERGAAPTRETVIEWGGKCDKVISYSDKTTFIRPSKMFNEDGSYTELYNNLLAFLKTEISRAKQDGDDARTIGTLRRRLHSLESNMVELFVGGITQSDRDATRDLVEDAVLNLRSAAENGVGLGANMSAASAIKEKMKNLLAKNPSDNYEFYNMALENLMISGLDDAYMNLAKVLYSNVSEFDYETACENAKAGKVYNIRTENWTTDVKTSIMSDITILDTVCRIVSIMATCNQFILPTAMHNIYEDVK